jgi:hypothetical protein
MSLMFYLKQTLLLYFFLSSLSHAQVVSRKQKFYYFGATYTAQWVYYLLDQKAVIEKTGSADNWINNPFKPHFDKDNFDYNIIKHSLAGNYYYLWYRSRSYTQRQALYWSFLSSLAFEFTIETITEKPSWQDIYQTPVFGTVLGMGFEELSLYFHRWGNWYGDTLGYILNPFSLIPGPKPDGLSLVPLCCQGVTGLALVYNFE